MRRLLGCLTAAAAALAGPTTAAPPATAADSGTFSVLAHHVAGPPEAWQILRGARISPHRMAVVTEAVLTLDRRRWR
ncbi:hypothetical protein GCM10010275_18430 [Streptomyces litmocidini]|uniref:hypothetical protein n=1 Tax=Streptomyces litmocidini TaxID=67318 RepID=UPI00167EF2F5|nr:hypothetical protein [Streptomyces litmocidini]GGU83511.1 hypothetical protein GCM10010275_18430 [Streptomyces litmocidini]